MRTLGTGNLQSRCSTLYLPRWFYYICYAVCVKVMREMLDGLDEIISEGRGDVEYKQLFADM